MEGIFTSVISGVTGPLASPFLRRGEAWFRLRELTQRPIPAVICPAGKRHECPNIVDFLPASKDLLKREPWLKSQLKDAEVSMKYISGILRDEQLWNAVDANFYKTQTILILGAQKPRARLAVVLGVISSGGLKHHCCQQTTIEGISEGSDRPDSATTSDDSFVTCMSHPLADSQDASEDEADAVIDMRDSARQDSFSRRTDWRDAQSAFGEHEPYDGLPVSVSTVVVNMELEVLCHPRLRIFVPERTIRDLGRFMYDPRGCFRVEVVVAMRMCTPLGEVRSWPELPEPVHYWFGTFRPTGILCNADYMVFERICYGNDDRYREPVRKAFWDDYGVDGLTRSAASFSEFQLRPDWRMGPMMPPPRNRRSGRIFLNRKQHLSSVCREFIKACRFLGFPVESADLDFGLFWLVSDAWCHIYLGHFGDLTHRDLPRYYQKLVESGNVRRYVGFWCWNETTELSNDPQGRYFVWNKGSEELALEFFASFIPQRCTRVYIS